MSAPGGTLPAFLVLVLLSGPLAACGAGSERPDNDRAVDWGMHVIGGWPEIEYVEEQVGRRATLIASYVSWGSEPGGFYAAGAAEVDARGATPLITWEPWGPPWETELPAYRLATIVRGDHDEYIRRFAADVAAYGRPVMIRFGHEMNGDWYPWSEHVNGNRPGEYVAAWRHVHDTVAAAGASNVTWIWSPNVVYPGSTDLSGLYPGDDYVDWIAVDGYNSGTPEEWSSFAEIFEPSISLLTALAPTKPLMIAEVGSAEAGGSKAEWVEGMFTYINKTPTIDAFVWFNEDKGIDWRIQSSQASINAFRDGLALSLYNGQSIP